MISSNDVLETFSERLKDLLQSKGLSIKELSEQIGIPKSTINGWTLKISLANIYGLRKIAEFFGVTADYLIGLEN
ncbi:MAG: helix-turn-helix transcriptional regulator [Clostridia bacterium]|nr:helix-turn-helix transcriptional regulator [Clostridia bacterium]